MPNEDSADLSLGVSVMCAYNDRKKLDTFLLPKYIINKFREDVEVVYTTVGSWKTR